MVQISELEGKLSAGSDEQQAASDEERQTLVTERDELSQRLQEYEDRYAKLETECTFSLVILYLHLVIFCEGKNDG